MSELGRLRKSYESLGRGEGAWADGTSNGASVRRLYRSSRSANPRLVGLLVSSVKTTYWLSNAVQSEPAFAATDYAINCDFVLIDVSGVNKVTFERPGPSEESSSGASSSVFLSVPRGPLQTGHAEHSMALTS